MIIMAIDASSKSTGIAVFDEQKLVHYECIAATDNDAFTRIKKMVARIKNIYEAWNVTNVIMYIDLDNFKYYNDTVGHEIGDLVLVLFSNILKECAKDNGVAIRYGGDEFLLVFNNKDCEYAVRVAKRIYAKILDGFASNIEKRLKKKVIIPEEKKLSCCIGIAEFISNRREAIVEALERADEALYSVKNTTKHDYKVWKDEDDNEKN